MKYCVFCAEELPDDANFCSRCGRPQNPAPQTAEPVKPELAKLTKVVKAVAEQKAAEPVKAELLKSGEAKVCGNDDAKAVREREEADGGHGYCPWCGGALAEEATHCPKCREQIKEERFSAEMIKELGVSPEFCENCGAKLFGFWPKNVNSPHDAGVAIGNLIAAMFSHPKADISAFAKTIPAYCPKCGAKVGETDPVERR